MKYLIIILSMTLCIYIGYSISKKYKKRSNFFKATVMLCQKFDVQINYSRDRVKMIFEGLDEKHKGQLYGIDKNYIAYLNQENQLDKENLFKSISFLKEEEKDILFMFFKNLGRSDVESQSKEVKNFQSRFEELASASSNDMKKYGNIAIKLGIVAGLFIAVVLI